MVSESNLIVGPAHDRQRSQEPDGEHQWLLFMLVKAATRQLLDGQGKCGWKTTYSRPSTGVPSTYEKGSTSHPKQVEPCITTNSGEIIIARDGFPCAARYIYPAVAPRSFPSPLPCWHCSYPVSQSHGYHIRYHLLLSFALLPVITRVDTAVPHPRLRRP